VDGAGIPNTHETAVSQASSQPAQIQAHQLQQCTIESDVLSQRTAMNKAAQQMASLTHFESKFKRNPIVDAASEDGQSLKTPWLMLCSALATLVCLPGLAMFYGGLARAESIHSTLLTHILTAALVTLFWICFGYSGAYSSQGMVEGSIGWRSIVGALDKSIVHSTAALNVIRNVREVAWITFQLQLAVLSVCIFVGATVERAKMTARLAMAALWLPLVYVPITHAVWAGPGSLLGDLGLLDFSGARPAPHIVLSHCSVVRVPLYATSPRNIMQFIRE
jgi:hypothetical protein